MVDDVVCLRQYVHWILLVVTPNCILVLLRCANIKWLCFHSQLKLQMSELNSQVYKLSVSILCLDYSHVMRLHCRLS